MIDDRVITDFADHLVPEAFARRHTAHRVEVVATPAGGAAFRAWLGDRLVAALTERYPWGGRPVRLVEIEAADGTRWRWHGEPCEEFDWLVSRIRREAADLVEPWLLAVDLPWPEPVRPEPEEDEDDPPAGTGPVEPPPDAPWTATWYAEARGRGVAQVLAGEIDLAGEQVVASRGRPPRQGLPGRFHRLLYRHPDRRHHPLR